MSNWSLQRYCENDPGALSPNWQDLSHNIDDNSAVAGPGAANELLLTCEIKVLIWCALLSLYSTVVLGKIRILC